MKITWGCGKIIPDNRIIIKNFTSKCTTQIANRIKTGWWKKMQNHLVATIWWQHLGGNNLVATRPNWRLSTWFSVFADLHFSNWFGRSLCLCISRGIWGLGVASVVELSPSLSETNWTRLQPSRAHTTTLSNSLIIIWMHQKLQWLMEIMGKNRMIIIKCIEKIDWIITEDYLVLARGPNISRAELNRDHHQTVPMDWLLRQLVVSTKT